MRNSFSSVSFRGFPWFNCFFQVEHGEECEYGARVTHVEDIQAAIVQLPRKQFERLAAWFDRRRETEFDRQIQADAKSGRLGELYARLESENAGQPDEPLAEFLGRSKLPWE
jgi:hypothetical protein